MSELKPCPFCGCEVHLAEERHRDPLMGWRTWYHIKGDHEGIGGVCPGQVRGRGSAETAITAWNTRADDAENERLRNELKAAADNLRTGQSLYECPGLQAAADRAEKALGDTK